MFPDTRVFYEFLTRSGFSSKVYDAMKNDDLSEVVIVLLDILKKTNHLKTIQKIQKCEIKSDTLREAGNKFLSTMDYKSALNCYNKALACAPNMSKAMALAYSNRSFIMLRLKRFKACIADIDHCFLIGCPENIKQKLLKRREEANKFVVMDSLTFTSLKAFTNNFFTFKSICHVNVPFVSRDVNIALEFSKPKITAANSINSGMILAVEEPYVAGLSTGNNFNCCYYCLTITPNLIPCNTCCSALFCSENCRIKCNEEYHNYECHIIDLMENSFDGAVPNLIIKSVLKLKSKLTWIEFIRESKTLGSSRIAVSTSMEVFNHTSNCSLLTFPENRPFIHGIMYNTSIVCAALLHYISLIPSFLPNSNKEEALKAVARIMMYLSIHGSQTYVVQTVTDLVKDKTRIQHNPNFAWYVFYGKMKMKCNPNAIASFIHNKAVLIAIRKIKPGEEIITLSFELTPNLPKHILNIRYLKAKGNVCSCLRCTKAIKNETLSRSQKECVKKANLGMLQANLDVWNISQVMERSRQLLDVLSDAPNSEEYQTCLTLFRNCITVCEALETENFDIL